MPDFENYNVRIARSVKIEADTVVEAMGMTLDTAINIFIRQMINEKAIPFRIHAKEDEALSFEQLIENVRTENKKKGFLSDEEIDAEIQLYRKEAKLLSQ